MLAQLMYRLGLLNSLREWNHSLYDYLQYILEIKKMSKICDFDITLNTECNLQHLDDFERDEADTYLRRTGLLNVKEKGTGVW